MSRVEADGRLVGRLRIRRPADVSRPVRVLERLRSDFRMGCYTGRLTSAARLSQSPSFAAIAFISSERYKRSAARTKKFTRRGRCTAWCLAKKNTAPVVGPILKLLVLLIAPTFAFSRNSASACVTRASTPAVLDRRHLCEECDSHGLMYLLFSIFTRPTMATSLSKKRTACWRLAASRSRVSPTTNSPLPPPFPFESQTSTTRS